MLNLTESFNKMMSVTSNTIKIKQTPQKQQCALKINLKIFLQYTVSKAL
jgi:hypothetical protein